MLKCNINTAQQSSLKNINVNVRLKFRFYFTITINLKPFTPLNFFKHFILLKPSEKILRSPGLIRLTLRRIFSYLFTITGFRGVKITLPLLPGIGRVGAASCSPYPAYEQPQLSGISEQAQLLGWANSPSCWGWASSPICWAEQNQLLMSEQHQLFINQQH